MGRLIFLVLVYSPVHDILVRVGEGAAGGLIVGASVWRAVEVELTDPACEHGHGESGGARK